MPLFEKCFQKNILARLCTLFHIALIFTLLVILLTPFALTSAETNNSIDPAELLSNEESIVLELNTTDKDFNTEIQKLLDEIKKQAGLKIPSETLSDLNKFIKAFQTPNRYLISLKLVLIENPSSQEAPLKGDFNLLFYNNAKQLQVLIDSFIKNGLTVSKNTYHQQEYYQVVVKKITPSKGLRVQVNEDQKIFLADIKGILVITSELPAIKNIIDLKPENSLFKSENYSANRSKILNKLQNSYQFFGFVNFEKITSSLLLFAKNTDFNASLDLIKYFRTAGIGLKTSKNGLQIESHVSGNPTKMDKDEFKFNMVDFNPNLFRKFPKANPFYYGETANIQEMLKFYLKILKKTENALNEQFQKEYPENDTPPPPKSNSTMFEEAFEEQTGLDLENDIFSWLDKESGLAIQDNGSLIPSLSLIFNAVSNPTAAAKFANYIATSIQPLISDNKNINFLKLDIPDSTLYQISFNVINLYYGNEKSAEALVLKELVKPIVITFGVTADKLFLISTYPEILTHLGEGLQENADFYSLYSSIPIGNGELGYLSVKNILNHIKRIADLGIKMYPQKLDLRSLHQFYSITDQIGKVQDLLTTGTNAVYETSQTSMIRTNDLSNLGFHDFQALLISLQNADSDQDGRSDYQEIYLEKTDPNTKDVLQKNNFTDTAENEWYSAAIHSLANQGVVSGYQVNNAKKEFRPGQSITRAEFIKMVVEAFQIEKRYFSDIPFNDADFTAWYLPYLAGAYQAGIISGYSDQTIRPLAKITRAEALKIVLTASKLYRSETKIKNAPFQDTADHWAKNYINFAYHYQLITGINPTTFAADREITRAEAAKLIITAQQSLFERLQKESLPTSFKENLINGLIENLF